LTPSCRPTAPNRCCPPNPIEEGVVMAVEPFKIQVPDSVLDDLKSRLERTRWPEELRGTD